MRRLTLPLYVGGFLGPFGGAMLIALIPNVAEGLDASIGYVPLFHADTRAPFLLAAGFSLLLALLIVPWFGRYRAAV